MANRDLEKEIELLKEAAKLRADMSSSLDGYYDGLKKIKALSEEIKRQDEIITKFEAEKNSLANSTLQADIDRVAELNDILDILAKEKKLLNDNLSLLKESTKEINKRNLLIAKGGAAIVKSIAALPNIVESAYGKIKGYGLFDMDKAMKQTALSMGLAREQSQKLRGDIESASMNTTMFGAGIEELAKYQAEYSEELGRSVMLGQKGLEAIAEMAKGTTLGAEGAAKMAADFELQGYSAERTRDFVEDAVNKSAKMGLNSSKVIKNMQQNMKLLNKYNFKGGVKGLQKMAETTSKLGVDMNFATGMAEKLFDIEGAVEMSAQLQVLGGAWANLGDPFKLMYMARNDMAGLTEEVAKAAASTAKFNSETGEFDISAMEMQRLRKVAEATGMEFESLVTASKNAAKFTKIKKQMSFAVDKDTKEFIENTAKMDEKGKAYIEVKGEKKFINELSKEQIKTMMGEKESLKERAEQARTFDETLTNTINMFKQSLLPFVESLEPLIKGFDNFVNQAKTDGWFTKIKEFASSVGSIVATVGKLILENPLEALITYGFFKAATWFASGVSLGHGFNSVASVGSSGGSSGGSAMDNMFGKNRGLSGGAGRIGKAFSKGGFGAGTKTMSRIAKSTLKGNALTSGVLGLADVGMNLYEGKDIGESLGRALLSTGGSLLGGVGGSFIAPGAGTIAGGIGGGMVGDKLGDLIFGDKVEPPANDAILSGGKITPIHNKDELMAFKKGGPIDNMMSKNTGVNNIKHEFGELTINGKIEVTSPGNSSTAVDLMRDPQFIRELQMKISQDLIIKENQVVKKG